ncbi:NAD-dependent epimerase/dehydratase family protein [Kribbella sp. NPDC051620]|uniref:NAD-dependent epimerase/dehydratase family protein n=1 Tax=Kribbella sp. NPDC051620 TaxID=3364120 RepID=UPI0037AC8167
MRVFLAGATGAVGRLLVPELVAAGHQVTGLIRRPEAASGLRSQGADSVLADVYDASAVAAAVAAAAPDVVMHQLTDLANQNYAGNMEIRRTGTRNLVDAAAAAGVRKVIAQSIAWAYAPTDDVPATPAATAPGPAPASAPATTTTTPAPAPATEQDPLDLRAEGARRQTVAAVGALEDIVAEAPEWVVLRYGLFYGPGTWYAKGGLMDDAVRAGKVVPNADVTSFLHIEDAATAAVQALEWPTGPVNIVDDEPAAGTAWVPTFARSVGAPEPEPVDSERTPWARGADNHYARKHLKWTPRYPSWRDGFVA